MTAAERAKPAIINGSRRERIARGAGVTVYDVNQLLKQFAETRKLMKQFQCASGKGKRRMRFPGMRQRASSATPVSPRERSRATPGGVSLTGPRYCRRICNRFACL